MEGTHVNASSGEFLDCKRAPNIEEDENDDHIHTSINTLCKDPFRALTVAESSRSRVICASLEDNDHGQENSQLKEEAIKPELKRKEAMASCGRRTYAKYRNCDYRLLDISSFETRRGAKRYYQELTERASTL